MKAFKIVLALAAVFFGGLLIVGVVIAATSPPAAAPPPPPAATSQPKEEPEPVPTAPEEPAAPFAVTSAEQAEWPENPVGETYPTVVALTIKNTGSADLELAMFEVSAYEGGAQFSQSSLGLGDSQGMPMSGPLPPGKSAVALVGYVDVFAPTEVTVTDMMSGSVTAPVG